MAHCRRRASYFSSQTRISWESIYRVCQPGLTIAINLIKSHAKKHPFWEVYRVPHKVSGLKANKSHDFQKFNFKITARALSVIPPKFTGVPVTFFEH
jgi:hypothetical protein